MTLVDYMARGGLVSCHCSRHVPMHTAAIVPGTVFFPAHQGLLPLIPADLHAMRGVPGLACTCMTGCQAPFCTQELPRTIGKHM
jgi:hypothetical protein